MGTFVEESERISAFMKVWAKYVFDKVSASEMSYVRESSGPLLGTSEEEEARREEELHWTEEIWTFMQWSGPRWAGN
jgi:hypothetical protein